MHIKTLRAQNFRCFQDLQISFQPGFNLLIGNNMSGKTAVLDALRICLNGYVRSFAEQYNIEKKDIRLSAESDGKMVQMVMQFPALVECSVDIRAVSAWRTDESLQSALTAHNESFPSLPVINSYYMVNERGRVQREQQPLIGALDVFGAAFLEAINRSKTIDIPLLAHFDVLRVDRLASEERAKKYPRNMGRRSGFLGALEPSSMFGYIREWIQRRAGAEIQRIQRRLFIDADDALEAIKQAVCTVIPGVKDFYFDFEFDDLTVVFADGRYLPWVMLSDGMRSLISLVMEIAWRAVTLNPHMGIRAPAETLGIVLIDEIDLYLHPAWQRTLVPALKRSFPKLQFIATTHSPLILAGMRPDQDEIIRLSIDPHGVVIPDDLKQGREHEPDARLMTGTEIYRTYFGIDKLYPGDAGNLLREHRYLAADPGRSAEDDQKLDAIEAKLKREGVMPDFERVPRSDA